MSDDLEFLLLTNMFKIPLSKRTIFFLVLLNCPKVVSQKVGYILLKNLVSVL